MVGAMARETEFPRAQFLRQAVIRSNREEDHLSCGRTAFFSRQNYPAFVATLAEEQI